SDPRETGADSRPGRPAADGAPAAGASPITRPVAAMSVAVERVWRDIVLLGEPWTGGESTGVTYATLLTLVTRYSREGARGRRPGSRAFLGGPGRRSMAATVPATGRRALS